MLFELLFNTLPPCALGVGLVMFLCWVAASRR